MALIIAGVILAVVAVKEQSLSGKRGLNVRKRGRSGSENTLGALGALGASLLLIFSFVQFEDANHSDRVASLFGVHGAHECVLFSLPRSFVVSKNSRSRSFSVVRKLIVCGSQRDSQRRSLEKKEKWPRENFTTINLRNFVKVVRVELS